MTKLAFAASTKYAAACQQAPINVTPLFKTSNIYWHRLARPVVSSAHRGEKWYRETEICGVVAISCCLLSVDRVIIEYCDMASSAHIAGNKLARARHRGNDTKLKSWAGRNGEGDTFRLAYRMRRRVRLGDNFFGE